MPGAINLMHLWYLITSYDPWKWGSIAGGQHLPDQNVLVPCGLSQHNSKPHGTVVDKTAGLCSCWCLITLFLPEQDPFTNVVISSYRIRPTNRTKVLPRSDSTAQPVQSQGRLAAESTRHNDKLFKYGFKNLKYFCVNQNASVLNTFTGCVNPVIYICHAPRSTRIFSDNIVWH